jgi:hypothetical protein
MANRSDMVSLAKKLAHDCVADVPGRTKNQHFHWAASFLCQFRQQRLCFLQIRRIKPFGEPAVDLRQ